MSDLLNPKEVDALLEAVAKGNVAPSASDADAEVHAWDFARPDRFGREGARVLAAVHEGFAQKASACLSDALRRDIEASLVSVDSTTASEFAASAGATACLALISPGSLVGTPIIEIDPSIAFPIIDRLLGGEGDPCTGPDRPLTEIETRLLLKAMFPLAPLLKEAWGASDAEEFSITEVRTGAQLAPSAAAHDPAEVVTFELKMGEAAGRMRLMIPCSTIEPILRRPGQTGPWETLSPAAADAPERIAQSLAEAPLSVVADLAETQITVRELIGLEPGDLLKTDAAVDSETTVYVEGIPKFKGKPGRNRRNKAVLITRALDPGKTR